MRKHLLEMDERKNPERAIAIEQAQEAKVVYQRRLLSHPKIGRNEELMDVSAVEKPPADLWLTEPYVSELEAEVERVTQEFATFRANHDRDPRPRPPRRTTRSLSL